MANVNGRRFLAGPVLALAGMLLSPAAQAREHRPVDLPGERVFPESISVAPDGMAYNGSALGGVLRTNLKTGTVEPWIAPGGFGSGSIFGVLVDAAHGLLWLCSNDLSAVGVTIAGADKGSWLKAFDLKTGQGKVSLALPTAGSLCNDMAVAADGTVYVAETNHSQILRRAPGADALEVWLADPALGDANGSGLDGIALGGDGQLYVNNFRSNILARVTIGADGKPGAVTPLATSMPLDVPDGLRPLGGQRFVMAEASGRVEIVTIEGDKARIEPIAQDIGAPSGVHPWDGAAWIVEGHLAYIFNPARRAETPPLPFRITPVPLPAASR